MSRVVRKKYLWADLRNISIKLRNFALVNLGNMHYNLSNKRSRMRKI